MLQECYEETAPWSLNLSGLLVLVKFRRRSDGLSVGLSVVNERIVEKRLTRSRYSLD